MCHCCGHLIRLWSKEQAIKARREGVRQAYNCRAAEGLGRGTLEIGCDSADQVENRDLEGQWAIRNLEANFANPIPETSNVPNGSRLEVK